MAISFEQGNTGEIPRFSLPVFPKKRIAGKGLCFGHAPAGQAQRVRQGRGKTLQILLCGVKHGPVFRRADSFQKCTYQTEKQVRIPCKGRFRPADRPQGRGIHLGKNAPEMICLRQGFRDGSPFQAVIYRHADPRPAGRGCRLCQVRRASVLPRRGGQHRKTDAVRRQSIKIYVSLAVNKNAFH